MAPHWLKEFESNENLPLLYTRSNYMQETLLCNKSNKEHKPKFEHTH